MNETTAFHISGYLAIRTEKEYEKALTEIERWMSLNPEVESLEGRYLETLVLHVKDFENRNYEIVPPDPIDAIYFRMDQNDLKQRDLIPFIGSKSRVSEVLARKRPLSLTMLRELHKGLGIPASILLKEIPMEELIVDWSRFPVKEMVSLGWIKADAKAVKHQAEELIREFFRPLGKDFAPVPFFRKTKTTRAKSDLDEYSLLAWIARIIKRAKEELPPIRYEPGSITKDDLLHLAKLSVHPEGPILARDFLKTKGVILIIERHLKGTKLDAAIIFQSTEAPPVIGMTLRYNRIDSFWFSLFHELAHLLLHFSDDTETFVDNLDVRYVEDPREIEADRLARDTLVPEEAWRNSIAFRIPSPSAAKLLAKDLGVHTAIVAGRIRYELNSYQVLHNLIGEGEVRQLFPEVDWS